MWSEFSEPACGESCGLRILRGGGGHRTFCLGPHSETLGDYTLVSAREDAISCKDSQLITPSVSAVAVRNGLTDWRLHSKNTPRRGNVGCSRPQAFGHDSDFFPSFLAMQLAVNHPSSVMWP